MAPDSSHIRDVVIFSYPFSNPMMIEAEDAAEAEAALKFLLDTNPNVISAYVARINVALADMVSYDSIWEYRGRKHGWASVPAEHRPPGFQIKDPSEGKVRALAWQYACGNGLQVILALVGRHLMVIRSKRPMVAPHQAWRMVTFPSQAEARRRTTDLMSSYGRLGNGKNILTPTKVWVSADHLQASLTGQEGAWQLGSDLLTALIEHVPHEALLGPEPDQPPLFGMSTIAWDLDMIGHGTAPYVNRRVLLIEEYVALGVLTQDKDRHVWLVTKHETADLAREHAVHVTGDSVRTGFVLSGEPRMAEMGGAASETQEWLDSIQNWAYWGAGLDNFFDLTMRDGSPVHIEMDPWKTQHE